MKKSVSQKSIKETPSRCTASTQFFTKDINEYRRITRKEYLGDEATSTPSTFSETFDCIHDVTNQRPMQGNILERLSPVPEDLKLTAHCPPAYGWFMAKKLSYFLKDPSITQNTTRLLEHFRDFVKITENGFKISILKELIVIFHYLCEKKETHGFDECLRSLIMNIGKPITLDVASDVITYLPELQDYIEHLGYLLASLDDDELFDLLSRGLLWQLIASNKARGVGTVRRAEVLVVASRVLLQTTVRMIAVTTSERLPMFLKIALSLGYHSKENCLEMVKEGILENIFVRFNPYSPLRPLPNYEINPADPQDYNVQIGDGNKYITAIISLLLIILEKTRQAIEKDSSLRVYLLPCPDVYSQRCFVWGYRYQCRLRGHNHERNCLTVIVISLLDIYGERLSIFSSHMMPDVISMSVNTELSQELGWLGKITFNKTVTDVKFKNYLIRCSVKFIKTFPMNREMMKSRHWLLGLVYLIDPDLDVLRVNWSPTLYAELRKSALQAMICTLPYAKANVVEDYNIIWRMLWYAEWYLENPYELSTLYWSLRLLKVALSQRHTVERRKAMRTLFDTHGVVVLINLCYKLLEERLVEKRQIIISLLLQLVTSALEMNENVICCLYPGTIWPACVKTLSEKMLSIFQSYMERHMIFMDRLSISVINFIWEAVIWNDDNRKYFIANNGIYKLLDVITMAGRDVQCMCLALICDVLRAEEGIGHLITWRASIAANNSNLGIVKGGATIATLLARLFRDDCKMLGIKLDERNIIQDLEDPLMTADVRKALYVVDFALNNVGTVSAAAADAAGSRMSKVCAILQMLSEDLEHKVKMADETYNLYKNMPLSLEDEVILVLCSHYVTIKLNETWAEVARECPAKEGRREKQLQELLQLRRWWATEIKKQQEQVFEKNKKKEIYLTRDFFSFLSRIRLNVALDALRDLINAEKPITTMKRLLEIRHKAVQRHIACESLDADQVYIDTG